MANITLTTLKKYTVDRAKMDDGIKEYEYKWFKPEDTLPPKDHWEYTGYQIKMLRLFKKEKSNLKCPWCKNTMVENTERTFSFKCNSCGFVSPKANTIPMAVDIVNHIKRVIFCKDCDALKHNWCESNECDIQLPKECYCYWSKLKKR